MSFVTSQFRDLIVIPTLDAIGLDTPAAVNLLLMTCAQESHMGQYLHQLGEGPALGVFQMETPTYNSHWAYLDSHPALAAKIRSLAGARYSGSVIPAKEMIGNLYYATAMARVHYRQIPEALPSADDIPALAAYYKRYYNTKFGAATVPEVITNYRTFVEGQK